MSSSIVSEPLRAVLKTSRYELYFLTVAHALALWGILLAGVYLLSLAVLVSAAYYLRGWYEHKGAQLLQLQDDYCRLEFAQGISQQYYLGRRHFVSDFLVIVQMRSRHHRFAPSYYLPVFADAMAAESFRQIRVFLCLNQTAAAASSVASE